MPIFALAKNIIVKSFGENGSKQLSATYYLYCVPVHFKNTTFGKSLPLGRSPAFLTF